MTEKEDRWMGLDVGDVRIGVAVSDPMKIAASPFRVVQRKTDESAIREILEIAEKMEVSRIVVGTPLGLRGEKGVMARKIGEFCRELSRKTAIPLEEWDERFSTRMAERTLIEGKMSRKKRKQVVDKTAAALILQGYLDSKSGGMVTPEFHEIWLQEQKRDEENFD